MTPIAPRDVRGQRINFRADPDEKDRIRKQAAEAGMLPATWLRERLLEAAGYQDNTRRAVPMRPGRRTRPDLAEDNAPVAISLSPREKRAIEKAASKAKTTVTGWIRDNITEA